MDPSRLENPVTYDRWEDALETDWLGAEASVRVRDGRAKRSGLRPYAGVMLVSLGFAVGVMAGALAWAGLRSFFAKTK